MRDVSVRAVGALLRLAAIPKHDWESSIQQILEIDSEVLGLRRVSYWSLREEPTLIHCEMGYVAEPRGFERGSVLRKSECPSYFEEIERATVLEIVDALGDPRTRELHDYLSVRRISSMLDVPVWAGGRVCGVLCHEHTGGPRQWLGSDLDFAAAVAQTVGGALEGCARGIAEEGFRQTAFLDRSARGLAEARSVREVAQRAASMAVPALAAWATVDLVMEGDLKRAAMAHNTARGLLMLEDMSQRFPPVPNGPHLSARVLKLKQSVVLPEVTEAQVLANGLSLEHAAMLRALGTHSAVAVPLLVRGRPIGALVLCATGRRYSPNDLRMCEEFGQRLAVALENAQLHEQAQTAVRARDEFIALAAHELHSPLASLQLAADSLVKRAGLASNESLARMADTVASQTRRLSRLVDHMLDASRIMARRLTLAIGEVDLSKLLRELAPGFDQLARRAQCTLEWRIEPNVTGSWDSDRLSQLLTNLLDNAIKFGASKPIVVELSKTERHALLRVRDQGIGIPKDRVESIFDPFVRAVSPRNFGGLGLGLFTAKAIIDAHGGEIMVESEPGLGSTFSVRLPRAGSPATHASAIDLH